MPIYVYRDDETGFEKDVHHSMAEIDEPSEETLKEITHEGRLMHRVPCVSNFSVFGSMSLADKKVMLRKRASDHANSKHEKEARDYANGREGKTS